MAKDHKTTLSAADIVEIIRAVDETSLAQVNVEVGDVWLKIKGRKVNSNVAFEHGLPEKAEDSAPVVDRDADTLEQTTTIAGASNSLLVDTTRTGGMTGLFELRAPVEGIVRRRSDVDGKHWVGMGNLIEVGDALCILESDDGLISLHSEVDGTVVDICVEEIEQVEAGQVLFRAEPA